MRLHDQPHNEDSVRGVLGELLDCAYPLVRSATYSIDYQYAFKDTDYNFLIGAVPRQPSMQRNDFLLQNAAMFAEMGKAMNLYSNPKAKTVVIGNPPNTNALVLASNCPRVPKQNITAMSRLDHNRSVNQVKQKLGLVQSDLIENVALWGNHSPTMFPDLKYATLNGQSLISHIVDDEWACNEFVQAV